MKKVFAILFAVVLVCTLFVSASASERKIYPTRINADAEDDDVVIYTRAFGEAITASEGNDEHGFRDWLVISARYSALSESYVVNAVYNPGTADKHVSIPSDGFVLVCKPRVSTEQSEASSDVSVEPLISMDLSETSFVSSDQSGSLLSTVESFVSDVLPTMTVAEFTNTLTVGTNLYLSGIDIEAGVMTDGAYISLDEITGNKIPNEVSEEQSPETGDNDIRTIAIIMLIVSAAAFLGLKYRRA